MGDIAGWAFAAVIVLAWLGIVGGLFARQRRLAALFEQAGKKLGLSAEGTRIRGAVHGLDVHLEMTGGPGRGSSERGVRVKVWAPRFPPPDVIKLVRPRLDLPAPSGLATRPVEPIYEGLALSMDGVPRAEWDLVALAEHLMATVRQVLLAPIPEYLRENLAADRPAHVRLASLQALVEQYRKSEATARALNACLTDPDPELRGVAALGTSIGALEAFVLDVKAPTDVRWDALLRLEARVGYERLSVYLGKVLDLPDDTLPLRALFVLEGRKDRTHLEKICSLAKRPDPVVAEAVARTLRTLECRSEVAMLDLLAAKSDDARRIAIAALREWGTVEAVEPLLESADAGHLPAEAREAVRAIQGRLSNAESGGVSVVEAVAGSGDVSLSKKA